MTRQTKECMDLDAIAAMVAHCRESSRALRLDTLTYYLDMADVAARSDVDRPWDRVDGPALRSMSGLSNPAGSEPGLLDLKTIRTAVEGCRNWARDLDRSTLVYVLNMALIAANKALNEQD